MNLKKVSPWYLVVILWFPFYGVFGYLRGGDYRVLGYVLFILPFTLYVFGTTVGIVLRGKWRVPAYLVNRNNRAHLLFFAITFCFMGVGLIRAAVVGNRNAVYAGGELFMLVMVVAFWVLWLGKVSGRSEDLLRTFDAVSVSLFLYGLANYIGVVVGLQNRGLQAHYTREFVALFNPTGVRIAFPFIQSGQLFSICGGVSAILALGWLQRSTWIEKGVGTLMLFQGVAILLGQSARAPILGLIMVFFFAWLIKKSPAWLMALFLVAIILAPVALAGSEFSARVEAGVERSGIKISRVKGDVASFSNRDVIWRAVTRKMMEDSSISKVMFGYGAYGHVGSGVVDEYEWLFSSSYEGVDAPPVHNTFLQFVLDNGVVGGGAFLSLVVAYFGNLRKTMSGSYTRRYNYCLISGMVILYLLICGVTEISIGYYAFDLLTIFVFINLFLMALVRKISRNGYAGREEYALTLKRAAR